LALGVSERFVQYKISNGELRVRLLRPDVPRIVVAELLQWLSSLKRGNSWPKGNAILGYHGTASGTQVASPADSVISPMTPFTYSQVAIALSVSLGTVRNLATFSGLPVVWISSRLPRVLPAELLSWVRGLKIRPARMPNPAEMSVKDSPQERSA
jgi:hypothetical protein